MTMDINALPKYSKEEEIFNSASHYLGFLFGIGTLFYFISFNMKASWSFLNMLPFYFYSFFMCMMFFVSGFYHSRPFHSLARARARTVDHCDIYAFVAATYLPICIYGIKDSVISTTLLVMELVFAVIGIILNALPKESRAINIISYIIYILAGWAIIFFYPFNLGIPFLTFLWVLIGGISYTVGAILYALGRKNKWFHSVFHVFVLLAAIAQFVGIVQLLY